MSSESKPRDRSDQLDFAGLIVAIEQTHAVFATQASKAVNISLTLRNWLIGYYIAEYELKGADRAGYGERLLELLAEQLGKTGLKRLEARELRRFRQFYNSYPHIREALSPVLAGLPGVDNVSLPEIRETVSPETCVTLPTGPNARLLVERLGQLNAYVSYYKQHQMTDGDQPPVGILLCTQKNHEMVQFALADMNNSLFVSRYQLQLPPAGEMEDFLRRALVELGEAGPEAGRAGV